MKWLREPLLHFLVLGGVLFFLDKALNQPEDQIRQITISPNTKQELNIIFKNSRGREPSDEELTSMVETWLKNELLYREGITLGLDKGDPMIRERVIHKMRLLIMNSIVIEQPNEDQLRQWFEKNREKYDKPKRFDFAMIKVDKQQGDGKPEAERLLLAIENGDEPAGIGRKSRGFRNRSRESIADMFGDEFTDTLITYPLREWQVTLSKQGWILARLDAVYEGEAAEFEKWRWKIEKDWQEYRQRKLANEALDELRNTYRVELQG